MLSQLWQLSFKVILHNIHFTNLTAVFWEYIILRNRKFQQHSSSNWWVITPQRLPKLPLKLMANIIFQKCEMVKLLYTLNMVSNVKMIMFQIAIFEEINLFQYKSLFFSWRIAWGQSCFESQLKSKNLLWKTEAHVVRQYGCIHFQYSVFTSMSLQYLLEIRE